MTDDPRRPGVSRRRRTVTLVLAGLVLAAIVGGVVGGLIVRATWGSGHESSSEATGACPATSVSDKALPSVVTVRAGTSSGSGVVIRTGGYILTNNHVISAVANGGPLSVQRADGQTSDATLSGATRSPISR